MSPPGRIQQMPPSRSKSLESWYASLPKLPQPPTAVFASAHALSELDVLHEPMSTAAHTAGEHVRKLESSGAFSSRAKLANVENAGQQVTYTLAKTVPLIQIRSKFLAEAS